MVSAWSMSLPYGISGGMIRPALLGRAFCCHARKIVETSRSEPASKMTAQKPRSLLNVQPAFFMP
jgi:hypothetical protein